MMKQIIQKKNGNWIIRLIVVATMLHFSIFNFQFSICSAQTGSWKAYMSYYEPQQIVKAGSEDLFVRASNALYRYNLTDQSITTYDKVRNLNDTYVSLIAWNNEAKRLIIVYNNSNIDLLNLNDQVVNLSAIYNKSTTLNKTINSIYNNKGYAYLATGFGVMKVNVTKAEISESYILNQNITSVGIQDNQLYACSSEGIVYVGDMSKNLIDYHNWTTGTAPANVFNVDNSAWDQYLETVKTLNTDGPKYNNFGFMRFKDNLLLTASGASSSDLPGTVQIYDGEQWIFLQDNIKEINMPGTESGSWRFVNTYSVDIDPLDSKHIYVSGRTGLYEYYDGEVKNYFNKDNSILRTATTSNKYVIVSSCTYDPDGNLWIIQSDVAENSIIEITKDGEWIKHPQDLLMNDGESLKNMVSLFQDSRGLFWFVNSNYAKSSFFCYNPQTDQIVNSMFKLVNQDGTSYPDMFIPHCITEDLEGNIWIGTQYGPFMIEASRVNEPLEYVTQVKVPRNDGTNYADYLLANTDISCMAIDGGNRKWIGTSNNGVYLISADNMEQLQNFTTENSPLLSNEIRSIAINHQTGEVFFGTNEGLCSYMSDAVQSSTQMIKDAVYAYPNPVVSGYNGLITVVGLSYDSDVKILTTSGQLVAQGRSNGGMFTWDGRDSQGRHVATGVYMVAAATSEGKKGVVCKIAVIK